jgi:hypothetical protein
MARKKQQQPSSLLGMIFHFWHGVAKHIYVEAALLGSLILVLVVYMIVSAVSTEPEPEPLALEAVPLAEENVGLWCDAAKEFGEARAAGKAGHSVKTLPEFIEWGRRHQWRIEPHLTTMQVQDFLNLALGVLNARKRLREFVEFGMRVEAEEKAFEKLTDTDVEFRFSPAPQLEAWEEVNLAVYEQYQALIDPALEAMIPAIPLPVPAWEAEKQAEIRADEEAYAAEEGQETKPTRTKKLTWRVINTSPYGPKIIRKR